ncbi:hypothetical protein VNI00_008796 [Paramarasmius palmivorus]|uniref:Uncharacterized protein n=1 Tax=Paramarasmius palmivorus TaxID=297713 RepID=A0AAW0CVV7_9AGAR
MANDPPIVTSIQQQRQAKLATELWDQVFYHANQDAKDALHLAIHAGHRLINRTLGAVAERRFFEEIFLPDSHPRRTVRCMQLMASEEELAKMVKVLYVELDFDLYLFRATAVIHKGMLCLSQLRCLQMRTEVNRSSTLGVSALLQGVHFPKLQEFIFLGTVDSDTQEFVVRHASTLQTLTLLGEEGRDLSQSGPAFPVLFQASVHRQILAFILNNGAPALKKFHTPCDTPPGEMRHMIDLLRETRGASLEDLELVATSDYGESLFYIVSGSFRNLTSLSLICTMERALPFQENDLDDQVTPFANARRESNLNWPYHSKTDGQPGPSLLPESSSIAHFDLDSHRRVSRKLAPRVATPAPDS